MQYRRLGRAGVRLSEIGLGSWLTYGGSVDPETSRLVVERAYDLGVTFFDTADSYYAGEAEAFLGKVLPSYRRSSYVLSTKAFWPVGEGPNDRGLSRKHIMESVHGSLRRLRTDYVDIFFCHRFDPETPVDETLRAMDDLVRQGKVLYLGVSEWEPDQIRAITALTRAMGTDPIVGSQPQYSMLWRKIEEEILPLSLEEGIGQVVWSPLAQGVLTGKYRPGSAPGEGRATGREYGSALQHFMRQEVLQAVQSLIPVARDAGLTLSQLALAWVLRERGVTSAIVGATRPEQIEENVGASGVTLGPDVIRRIEETLSGVL